MKINIIRSIKDADKATGLAVIIDVFRAFSTEAYMFANGVQKIIPVLDLEDALKLKKENPDYFLAGERGGIKPAGFDFGNGPTDVLNFDLSGKTIIHTTSNGTRGLIGAFNAKQSLVGSFLIANSIVSYIKNNNIEDISLIATDSDSESDNEDILLAYYIRDSLNGLKIDENELKMKLRKTSTSFLLKEAGIPDLDIDMCLELNKFNFVIKKEVVNGQMILIKEDVF